jgi:hypothetical protein
MAKNELDLAAEEYAENRLKSFPFPNSQKEYRLLLEIAFMEGSQWRLQYETNKVSEALKSLQHQQIQDASMREEAANAKQG